MKKVYQAIRHRVREWRGRAIWSKLPRLAPAVREIAETGIGADECLKHKCLPMLVHYYSPVPDIDDLKERRVWSRRSELVGLDLQEDRQLTLLAALGREFGEECRWPHEPAGDESQFFTDNSGFSYGCAAATHGLIRRFKPSRVIEVGSGASSRVIAAALRINERENRKVTQYTIVDPYPTSDLEALPGLTNQIKERVELIDIELFKKLQPKDILFIDSGHTVRIGGDVNFLILDVLPVLPQGVVIHFHDIPMPYEYAEAYFTNPRFRMFWTESYLLQAFLCFNSGFEVLLAMNYLMLDREKEFRAAWPHYDPLIHRYPSHSFWIRRTQ